METVHDMSSSAFAEPARAQASLLVRIGAQSWTFYPGEGPVVIGRERPSQVLIPDDRISRAHVRLDNTPSGWVAVDVSRNGMFVNGIRQPSLAVSDAITVQLGHPQGIPVSLTQQLTTPAPASSDDDDEDDAEQTMALDITDPGIARAGAAVASRREELKLTQRYLAREGIVNAGALIDFEKGRRWPRKATRTKIEDALQWPHGTIVRLRREGNHGDPERTEVLTNSVRAPLMAEAVEMALTTIGAAIAALPDVSDSAFSARAATTLADLRRLESLAADAASSARGAPEVALVLSAVRKTYKDLMLRAARAPGATLGQRLYAARYRAELSPEEVANAAGVPLEVLAAADAEAPLDADTVAALSATLSALTRR
jgi:DNA-binding transcriptional regulator YiaG